MVEKYKTLGKIIQVIAIIDVTIDAEMISTCVLVPLLEISSDYFDNVETLHWS